MKIRVKKTIDATRRLLKAGVPMDVVDNIIGKTFDATENLDIVVTWHNKPAQWNLPPEVVELAPSTP